MGQTSSSPDITAFLLRLVTMVFNDENCILIKNLFLVKDCGARHLVKFTNKNLNKKGNEVLSRKSAVRSLLNDRSLTVIRGLLSACEAVNFVI